MQPDAANDANETPEVKNIVARPHHEILRTNPFRTAQTFLDKQPARKRLIKNRAPVSYDRHEPTWKKSNTKTKGWILNGSLGSDDVHILIYDCGVVCATAARAPETPFAASLFSNYNSLYRSYEEQWRTEKNPIMSISHK